MIPRRRGGVVGPGPTWGPPGFGVPLPEVPLTPLEHSGSLPLGTGLGPPPRKPRGGPWFGQSALGLASDGTVGHPPVPAACTSPFHFLAKPLEEMACPVRRTYAERTPNVRRSRFSASGRRGGVRERAGLTGILGSASRGTPYPPRAYRLHRCCPGRVAIWSQWLEVWSAVMFFPLVPPVRYF